MAKAKSYNSHRHVTLSLTTLLTTHTCDFVPDDTADDTNIPVTLFLVTLLTTFTSDFVPDDTADDTYL